MTQQPKLGNETLPLEYHDMEIRTPNSEILSTETAKKFANLISVSERLPEKLIFGRVAKLRGQR